MYKIKNGLIDIKGNYREWQKLMDATRDDQEYCYNYFWHFLCTPCTDYLYRLRYQFGKYFNDFEGIRHL